MSKVKSKNKFTIRGTQFKAVKKDIKVEMINDDNKPEEFIVGWVLIRGQEDPVYEKRVAPAIIEYQEETDLIRREISDIRENSKEGEDVDISIQQGKLQVIIERFMLSAVCSAIDDWDKDFFEEDFTYEGAMSLFSDQSNNHIYNQISDYIKERDDFLPHASA